MSISISNIRGFGWMVAAGALASGCMSMQNQPAMEALQQKGAAPKPYVEAYVEYRGPAERWSGPTTFLLHVQAKDNGLARVSVTPALFSKPVEPQMPHPEVAGRALASLAGAASALPAVKGAASAAVPAPNSNPVSKGITGEAAREQLTQLASAIQGGDITFRGCLSPVRVRLIRSDGALLEKHGCRSQEGWPRAVSETVSRFILASFQ